jgi:hypothetical protein
VASKVNVTVLDRTGQTSAIRVRQAPARRRPLAPINRHFTTVPLRPGHGRAALTRLDEAPAAGRRASCKIRSEQGLPVRDEILSQIVGPPVDAEVVFDALMPRKVSNLLLVSSLYDYYTFIEDGTISEMLYSEFLDLDLRFTPSIERVSTAEEALERLRAEPFDLVISMAKVGSMDVADFGAAVQAVRPDISVALLATNLRELGVLPPLERLPGVEAVFVWLGDVRLFVAIIKHVEDRRNAAHDAEVAGVRSIILVEDSVQFYSSYLPMLYSEILKQTRAVTAESVTRSQKTTRMRARPKVLLARTYEEAMALYDQYERTVLGVIVDAAFPREGRLDPAAGFRFARVLKERAPTLPVLMQSESRSAAAAASLGLPFLDKSSPTLLADLRRFMRHDLGFGDFVFREPDGTVISRAPDLRSLEWGLQAVPGEYLLSNVARRDFCTWLIARTEFELAEAIRQIVERPDGDAERLRSRLLGALRAYRGRSSAGVVVDYSARTFEGGSGVVRIGRGSLGGKGRGLAFLNALLSRYKLERRFPDVRIFVPPTAVLTTGVFDRFMESSGLLDYALQETDDDRITGAFLDAELPPEASESLWNFLQWVRYPLAVRSSSLLEDASYQPFAGIYETYMIPNNAGNPEARHQELCDAVKRVYASTYHRNPKAYMQALPHRLEEEKMAVVIQQVVGRPHGRYLYPDFAGVGRSINFYAVPGVKSEDGVVSVALGLGRTVVEGGRAVRFCPACPRKPIQSFTTADYLENSQRTFFALDLGPASEAGARAGAGLDLVSLDIEAAERDGTLAAVGSTYSPDNDAIYDGLTRAGVRLVTMAGVLKGQAFPLAGVTDLLLRVGTAAFSCPVEIEFAVSLSEERGAPHEFAFLQIRPLVVGGETQDVVVGEPETRRAFCVSHHALGHGHIRNVRDVVYVRPAGFDRAGTRQLADEIGALNARLQHEQRPYVLIGPGRWGSADPWLGVPVKWAHISGVRCIVETPFADVQVDPSQGSHFFQNIVSFGIGYLTIDPRGGQDRVDLDWLDRCEAETNSAALRHVAFREPLHIAVNGRTHVGVVLKPD